MKESNIHIWYTNTHWCYKENKGKHLHKDFDENSWPWDYTLAFRVFILILIVLFYFSYMTLLFRASPESWSLSFLNLYNLPRYFLCYEPFSFIHSNCQYLIYFFKCFSSLNFLQATISHPSERQGKKKTLKNFFKYLFLPCYLYVIWKFCPKVPLIVIILFFSQSMKSGFVCSSVCYCLWCNIVQIDYAEWLILSKFSPIVIKHFQFQSVG